jgi:glutathione peroxidase
MVELSRRLVLGGAMTLAASAGARGTTMAKLAWDFSFPGIEGGTIALSALRGSVILVVNTASFCGFTYQYEALQKLHTARKADGLTVIGIPSQDFNQESSSEATVKTFCETTFGIDFPMTALLHVRGPQAHPFYQWVRSASGWEPRWNFSKVLIDRTGQIADTFGSADEPAGPRLTAALSGALRKG